MTTRNASTKEILQLYVYVPMQHMYILCARFFCIQRIACEIVVSSILEHFSFDHGLISLRAAYRLHVFCVVIPVVVANLLQHLVDASFVQSFLQLPSKLS
jgi:hypothetical protein